MVCPRALVLRTAGTNCAEETKYALELAGVEADTLHVNRLVHGDGVLDSAGLLVLPGGASHGDDIAGGKVLAVELVARLAERLEVFIERGGLILGIGNGFQALVKTGLLPYARPRAADRREFTLAANGSGRFEARWVRLRAPASCKCLFAAPGEEIELPVAHGEGKWTTRQPEAQRRLEDEGLVAYHYVGCDGLDHPGHPDNPNGSTRAVAGISDPSGRIFGLMPHPERHLFPWHHPRAGRERRAGEGDGMRIFRRAAALMR